MAPAATPPTVSLGPGSDFDRLHEAGFHLLLLGCRFSEGCTYLHHLEAMVDVPYRKWIELPRRVVCPQSSAVREISVRYFARRDEGIQERFDIVAELLESLGLLGRADAPYGPSFLVSLADLDRGGRACLARDPYALVRRRQESPL